MIGGEGGEVKHLEMVEMILYQHMGLSRCLYLCHLLDCGAACMPVEVLNCCRCTWVSLCIYSHGECWSVWV